MNNNLNDDNYMVTKGREQLEEAKRTYEILNSELHDELPALYDSRVLFYVNNLQTLFSAEQLFHSESHKVFGELEAITDKLATECQRGSYSKKLPANNVSPAASPGATLNNNINGGSAHPPSDTLQRNQLEYIYWLTVSVWLPPPPPPRTPNGAAPAPPAPRADKPLPAPPAAGTTTPPTPTDDTAPANDTAQTNNNTPTNNNNNKLVAEKEDTKKEEAKEEEIKKVETKEEETKEAKEGSDKKVEELYDIPVGSPVPPEKSNNSDEKRQQVDSEPREKGTDDKQDEVYDIPVGATLAGLPAGALYRVRATYRYTREDSDELSFDVGEIIRVVEYDDPDEQEEGWLMGIKETTNEKGMFPANFTRPI
ncbi:unnamed protein product [Arctia plantaginis]|uniref:Uncharacterized protein n=1 Tax=Arctia plantaginis TaxID=874455 RepID=A0A8S1BKU5_ARCPL|nr:unnamed protein product [Arctia plantaginis]